MGFGIRLLYPHAANAVGTGHFKPFIIEQVQLFVVFLFVWWFIHVYFSMLGMLMILKLLFSYFVGFSDVFWCWPFHEFAL